MYIYIIYIYIHNCVHIYTYSYMYIDYMRIFSEFELTFQSGIMKNCVKKNYFFCVT